MTMKVENKMRMSKINKYK